MKLSNIATPIIILICVCAIMSNALITDNINDYKIQASNSQLDLLQTRLNRIGKLVNSHKTEQNYIEGTASWYDYSLTGYPDYSHDNLTAASRDYKKGTKLQVCPQVGEEDFEKNPDLYQCVNVRVNDYGPDMALHPDRVIDLSSSAFKQIAPLSQGTIKVNILKISDENNN